MDDIGLEIEVCTTSEQTADDGVQHTLNANRERMASGEEESALPPKRPSRTSHSYNSDVEHKGQPYEMHSNKYFDHGMQSTIETMINDSNLSIPDAARDSAEPMLEPEPKLLCKAVSIFKPESKRELLSESVPLSDSEPEQLAESEVELLSESEAEMLSDSEPETLLDSEPETLSGSELEPLSDSELEQSSGSELEPLWDWEPEQLSYSEREQLSYSEPEPLSDLEVFSESEQFSGSEQLSDSESEPLSYTEPEPLSNSKPFYDTEVLPDVGPFSELVQLSESEQLLQSEQLSDSESEPSSEVESNDSANEWEINKSKYSLSHNNNNTLSVTKFKKDSVQDDLGGMYRKR